MRKVIVILLTLMLLGACSQPTPETAVPASTPEPEPTATTKPTNTPPPTPTMEPSPTPEPVPEPIVYEGSGDTTLQIIKPIEGDMCLLFVEGNEASEFFGMVAYDADGNLLRKLIITEKPYLGTRLLDGSPDKNTAVIDIRAVGPWKITMIPVIQPYVAEYIIDVTGPLYGNGDVVVLTRGESTSIAAEYSGDKHFVIHAQGLKTASVVFNEQGAYTGEEVLPEDTIMLEIMSEGDWEIDIK